MAKNKGIYLWLAPGGECRLEPRRLLVRRVGWFFNPRLAQPIFDRLELSMSEGKLSNKRNRVRKLSFESLELRRVMAGLPFGATPNDTGEFMLGRIAVTPVLLESDGRIDQSTEDWTASNIATVMSNIQEGLGWWNQLLAKKSSVHTIEWVIDRTFVDNRPSTPFEPINRVSNAYELWVGDFLTNQGFNSSYDLEQNMRAFNQSQRLKLQTDWSFTIFVVNSERDIDGRFAFGGSFTQAFAFAGGLFEVVPSKRPASTYTHETGHIFWARDEYQGGSSYYDRRGYYDTQNTNAYDNNPNPAFQQQLSIMSSGSILQQAYTNVVSPDATLAMVGWRDSDNDGIFDVLDVPLRLEGTGRFNPIAGSYAFRGKASVQTLPNRNSSGLQNDITLNRVSQIQYRIGNGSWATISSPDQYTVDLDLQISIPLQDLGKTIEIRAVDSRTGIQSNLFRGQIGDLPDTTTQHGIQGFVWQDKDQNRAWNPNELGLAGASVRLVDSNGQTLQLQQVIDPDAFPEGGLPGNLGGVRVDTVGLETNGAIGAFNDSAATTGIRIFKPYSIRTRSYVDSFYDQAMQLRARFDSPTSYVSIDAIAFTDNVNVRLDAYAADGTLIKRFERRGMLQNERVTMEVETGEAQIAYVIARGFQNSYVKFDNLRFGPKSSTVTAADGSYFLPNIAAGNYFVMVTGPVAGSIPTNTLNGILNVAYGSQRSVTHVDFGFYLEPSPWQNPSIPEDVDGTNGVNPIDVLILVNDINRYTSRSLVGSPVSPPPYMDVNGDRAVGPLDVLMVINYINRKGGSGGSGEGEFSAPPIVVESVHSGESPRLVSFATERSASAPTTWIVDRTGSAALRRQGPDRCGCPACIGWESTALPESSVIPQPALDSEVIGPTISLDAFFASL